MKFGAEPKKVAILGGLLCVAAYFYISGRSDDAPSSPKPATPQAASRVVPGVPSPGMDRPVPATRTRTRGASNAREFRPRQGGGKNGVDPITMDPTLRLDLLAKVQDVKMEGGARNLFQFGAPPAPKVPEVKVPVRGPGAAPLAPDQTKSLAMAIPPKPPPPAIPLKFYGYVSKNKSSDKRAFFIEGEDIFVAAEGETIKQRYKVVRIGVNSAVVEDVQFSHEQTLPLEEQAG